MGLPSLGLKNDQKISDNAEIHQKFGKTRLERFFFPDFILTMTDNRYFLITGHDKCKCNISMYSDLKKRRNQPLFCKIKKSYLSQPTLQKVNFSDIQEVDRVREKKVKKKEKPHPSPGTRSN